MTAPLFIWLGEALDDPWTYAYAGEVLRADGAAQKQALTTIAASEIIAIIPGQWVRHFPLSLPKMRERERLAAAGYAVEDQLGTGLAGQHIVISPTIDGGCAVVSEAVMDRVLQALDAAGVSPRAVYPDYDIAPAPCQFQNRIILPSDTDMPPMSFDKDWGEAAHDALPELDIALINTVPDTAVNLRSGAFAPGSVFAFNRGALGGLRLWPLAALFVAACCVSAFGMIAKTRAVTLQTENLRAETSAIYRAATGEVAPPNASILTLRALSNTPDQGSDFLSLSAALFAIISQIDGVSLETLRYDSDSRQLSFEMIYPAFDSGDSLAPLAASLGLSFEARGVRESAGTIRAEAVLRSSRASAP